ncbi:MAG: bifunctional phosphoglucose/phosphomannose isomerase [Candidatus Neomarinimicrobiota bacterium]
MKTIDKYNMFQSIWDFPENIIDALKISEEIKIKNDYENINKVIVAGMGGSAIGGDVVNSLIKEDIKIPFIVNRGYNLPAWVDSSTLIICSSYSGNTEETLSILEEANSINAKVISITTGGDLEKLCGKYDYDKVLIPSGLQPRAALAFSFIPLLSIMKKVGLIKTDIEPWLLSAATLIKSKRIEYSTDADKNPVWVLANKIYSKLPIIYADSDGLDTVAVRLKGQICENSKILAYHNIYPEMNHNEIVGWYNNADYFSNYFVLWLMDKDMNERNKARKSIISNILSDLKVKQEIIEVDGDSFKERFLLLIHYGDWLSYWCAIMHNTDPSPVKNIQVLKNKLSKI